MSIYLGMIVIGALPRDRYLKALTEIEQVMYVHKQDIQITNNDQILKFKIQETVFWLPRNPLFLNTIYYRVSGSGNLQLGIELVWDCLCILKEIFPSKIELYFENIDEFNLLDWEAELLRRQLNTLQNRGNSSNPLSKDEIDDVFAVLSFSISQNSSRGQEICLQLLNGDLVQPFYLMNLNEQQQKMLNQVSGYIKGMAQNISKKSQVIATVRNISQTQQDDELLNQIRDNIKYDRSYSINSIIFQLKESNDINRICFYLDYILNKNKSILGNIKNTIQNIIDKYFNGYYGLDQSELTRYCVFHTQLIEIVINYQLDESSTKKLYNIIEEGMINWLNAILQMDSKHIYSKFPQQLLKLYQNPLYKSHKSNILQLVCHKFGLNGPKSEHQRILQNIDDIQCISKELASFLESI